MVQVVAGHAAEAERVQVAEGDGRERHDSGRDLVHLGDVRVLEVEVDAVHAHEEQEGERAQEEDHPQAAFDAELLVRENVGDAVQGGGVRENFNGRRLRSVHLFGLHFEVHSRSDVKCQTQKAGAKRREEPECSPNRCKSAENHLWTLGRVAIAQADWRQNIVGSLSKRRRVRASEGWMNN